MDNTVLRRFLNGFDGAIEETPFGPQALVYKLEGKMFCTYGWQENPRSLTVKCPPEIGEILREKHSAISEGYYMNKRHWITIKLDGSLEESLIKDQVGASYALILSSLPKKTQAKYR